MRFYSFLAPTLKSYLTFRQKLGYTSFAESPTQHRAKELDAYIQQRGIRSLQHINERFLIEWIHAVPHRNPSTRNTLLWFVRGLFNYLIRLGVTHDNPAQRIRDLKTVPFIPTIFTLQEIHRLLETARAHRCKWIPQCFLGPTMETLIFLIYACGLRLSEALNLKIQDVDFEENTLSLWKTKFHKERLVPFSSHTALKLKAYLALRKERGMALKPQSRFFCHANGGYATKGSIEFQFRNIIKAVGLSKPKGIQGPRLHDLRHSMAVHRLYKWYQEGHDILNKLPLLSTYMGHVNIEKTQVYLTVTQALLREGDRRFQQAFEEITREHANRAKRKKSNS